MSVINSDAIDLIVMAFAIWRISSMLVAEDGPWEIFSRLRYVLGIKPDDMGVDYPTNEVAKALMCVWCTSVWISIVVSILAHFNQGLVVAILLPLCLSGVAIVVNRVVDK